MTSHEIICGDNLAILQAMPDKSVDLVLGSPPYEDARTYGIGYKLRGQQWVDWALVRYLECVRVSRGLVAWVVEGKTRNFRYSATPILLMADLHRAGVKLRKPPAFHRVGIPGSGGPDWLRNDYEFIVCASHGKLPWSDNKAMGHPPKRAPGGEMSNRTSDGSRVNSQDAGRSSGKRPSHVVVGGRDQWGGTVTETSGEGRKASGKSKSSMASRAVEPKAVAFMNGDLAPGSKLHTKNNGEEMLVQCYTPPAIANPGNVIHCLVGGGVMGSILCHKNEAPYPEDLAEFFIRSFCPPGGIVLDPFAGSGTTLAVAKRHGRSSVGIELRQSQVDLSKRRLDEVVELP